MSNFFLENSDLQFQFNNLNIKDIVDLTENNYQQKKRF